MHSYPPYLKALSNIAGTTAYHVAILAILCSPLHLNGLPKVSHITYSRSNVVHIAFFGLLMPPTLPPMALVGMLHERLGVE